MAAIFDDQVASFVVQVLQTKLKNGRLISFFIRDRPESVGNEF
jgi:hypothetical protein